MRKIETPLRRMYDHIDGNSRDSRVLAFVWIGTWSTAIGILPAWMIVSSVYVKFETTCSASAASRL